MKRTSWSAGLCVCADGVGVVAHAGSVVLRLLADRIGLTSELSKVMARRNFVPLHDRGQVLADVAVTLADGGEAMGLGQAGDPVGGGGEQDPVPLPAGRDTERGGQVALAGARWAEQDDVAVLGLQRTGFCDAGCRGDAVVSAYVTNGPFACHHSQRTLRGF